MEIADSTGGTAGVGLLDLSGAILPIEAENTVGLPRKADMSAYSGGITVIIRTRRHISGQLGVHF